MKVVKSKKVDKIRIVEHNKKILYWIFILIIVLIGVLIAIHVLNKQEDQRVLDGECVTDQDCISIETTCCPCNSGGEQLCVSKISNQLGDFEEVLRNCSLNTICPQVFNCKQTPCKCIEGKCSF